MNWLVSLYIFLFAVHRAVAHECGVPAPAGGARSRQGRDQAPGDRAIQAARSSAADLRRSQPSARGTRPC